MKYKSEILMVCHMDAQAMHKIGAISDKEMREYDKDCLVQEPKTASGLPKSPKTEYAAAPIAPR